MTDRDFPKPIGELLATLAQMFRLQNKSEIVELLEVSHAYFDPINYDNWNGGTTTWALRLEIPISIFAPLASRISRIEGEIKANLSYFRFDEIHPNDPISQVSVTPILHGSKTVGARMAPSESEVSRLWREDRFRLFLSHVAKHKILVSNLKEQLRIRGISAFVAHKDIEPSLEWQKEIELGLRSMYALAALITPEFHSSFWTDQEIGWALGRGIPVIPIRLGTDPYGFAGKFQGVSGSLEESATLAASIVSALLINSQTHAEMRRALVNAFVGAGSWEMAKALCACILPINDFTEEEKIALRLACTENEEVAKAYGVPDKIYKTFGKPQAPKALVTTDDLPF